MGHKISKSILEDRRHCQVTFQQKYTADDGAVVYLDRRCTNDWKRKTRGFRVPGIENSKPVRVCEKHFHDRSWDD